MKTAREIAQEMTLVKAEIKKEIVKNFQQFEFENKNLRRTHCVVIPKGNNLHISFLCVNSDGASFDCGIRGQIKNDFAITEKMVVVNNFV